MGSIEVGVKYKRLQAGFKSTETLVGGAATSGERSSREVSEEEEIQEQGIEVSIGLGPEAKPLAQASSASRLQKEDDGEEEEFQGHEQVQVTKERL